MNRKKVLSAIPALFLFVSLANAQTLVLQRSFIEKYKNRATIDGTFIVDHALAQQHAASQAGDLHAAGRSDHVGRPLASEVVNATLDGQAAVVQAMRANEGSVTPRAIAGTWRSCI